MAYGKMNSFIDLIQRITNKDAEGFVQKEDRILASLRAYKESRNSDAKWERINGNAAFASVSAIFRFRKIPELTVDSSLFIADGEGYYNIISAEDVRARGMYVEVLAEKIEGSVK